MRDYAKVRLSGRLLGGEFSAGVTCATERRADVA